MDCMEGIKLLEDKSIDLVLIDPPYLLNLTKVKITIENSWLLIDQVTVVNSTGLFQQLKRLFKIYYYIRAQLYYAYRGL